jgi:hypothetical protein
MSVLNFATNDQKDLILKIAQMELPVYAAIFKNPDTPERVSLREANLNRLGVRIDQLEDLHETVCKWREVFQNSLYEARKRIDSGVPSNGSQPAQANLPWQELFRTVSQLEAGDVTLFIDGILPEGITFIGALAGVGKSWFALSMAKALVTGQKFLGIHAVAEKQIVLYLSPEVGDKSLRKRLEKLKMPDQGFYCQTVKDGVLSLTNSSLETFIKENKPIVFLDTAIRFNPAADENSASQNAKMLAHDLLNLLRLGAKAVICLHHAPKYSSEAESMTLENALRGTGDLGAMCDAVWAIQHDRMRLPNGKDWDVEYFEESRRLTRLFVSCVKPRDFEAAASFRLQGRPYIDERGDFGVLTDRDDRAVEEQVIAAIASCPTQPMRTLRSRFGWGQNRIEKEAAKRNWFWSGKQWEQQQQPSKPF